MKKKMLRGLPAVAMSAAPWQVIALGTESSDSRGLNSYSQRQPEKHRQGGQ